ASRSGPFMPNAPSSSEAGDQPFARHRPGPVASLAVRLGRIGVSAAESAKPYRRRPHPLDSHTVQRLIMLYTRPARSPGRHEETLMVAPIPPVPALPLTPAPGRMNVDFEQRVDFARLREYRLARAMAALEASDLGALLVFDNNNIRYLTGV